MTEDSLPQIQITDVREDPRFSPEIVHQTIGRIEIVHIPKDSLESLKDCLGREVNAMGFLGIFAGAAISGLLACLTLEKVSGFLIGFEIAAAGMTCWFASQWWFARKARKTHFKRIGENTREVAVLGVEETS
jgi:hypothetical protein